MERARAKRRLFVGTYTEGTASEGIYVLAFDEDGRRLHIVNAGTHAPNPSYLVRAQPTGEQAGAEAGAQTKLGGSETSTLYAAHELADRSCLAAYEAAEDGTLCCRGTCSSSADAGTCFAAVHPGGRCLYGANGEAVPARRQRKPLRRPAVGASCGKRTESRAAELAARALGMLRARHEPAGSG